jgi:hypothetical protein
LASRWPDVAAILLMRIAIAAVAAVLLGIVMFLMFTSIWPH